MKKKSLSAMSAAVLMAGLAGAGQVQSAQQLPTAKEATTQSAKDYQAVKENKKEKGKININAIGGLDLPPALYKPFGLTPKEYGLRFGTGASRKGKSNRLRLAANAKLKRRKAC